MNLNPREPADPAEPRSAHEAGHRRRWAIVGLSIAVVLGLVAFVGVRWRQGKARPVDIADVSAPTGTTLPVASDVLRPPQGVYEYRGSGTDALDKPPSTQAQGPSMPGIVSHDDNGCWTFRIDYSTNHWQEWDYCSAGGGLDEVGGAGYQRWNFGAFVNETTSTFDCDAPTIKAEQEPGDEWQQSCTGTSTGVDGVTTSAGPYRFVGTETLLIGGRSTAAHHYRRERVNTGNQDGAERGDVWFSADTGMPLRNRHTIKATTNTVIGEVTYTEDGEFELTSLDPKG